MSVDGFETKTINKEDVIFYKISLYSYLTEKEWNIVHRYNEFYDLFYLFQSYFYKLPNLPGKSLGKVSNLTELNRRKDMLNDFLNEIVRRPDLLSNPNTIKFLKLENHFPDIQLFQPLLIYNLEDMTYPITAFYYDKRTSLLFLGLSNSSFQGKINNYFSKIFSGSSSKNSENTPGFLVIYNIIKNNSGAHHFEPLHSQPLTSEVSCINFYSISGNNILSLGLNSGMINLYKVFINESSRVSKELIEEICVIKAHKKKVLGVCFNFSLGYVYSVAKDCNLVISEMNYGSSMKSIPITKKEINCVTYDENWGRLFLTDMSGSIWILDLTTNSVCKK